MNITRLDANKKERLEDRQHDPWDGSDAPPTSGTWRGQPSPATAANSGKYSTTTSSSSPAPGAMTPPARQSCPCSSFVLPLLPCRAEVPCLCVPSGLARSSYLSIAICRFDLVGVSPALFFSLLPTSSCGGFASASDPSAGRLQRHRRHQSPPIDFPRALENLWLICFRKDWNEEFHRRLFISSNLGGNNFSDTSLWFLLFVVFFFFSSSLKSTSHHIRRTSSPIIRTRATILQRSATENSTDQQKGRENV